MSDRTVILFSGTDDIYLSSDDEEDTVEAMVAEVQSRFQEHMASIEKQEQWQLQELRLTRTGDLDYIARDMRFSKSMDL